MLYLRAWRLAKQMTLKDLEAATGIAFQMLSKYELASVDPPSSKLPIIAKALGIDEGQLFKPLPLPAEEPAHA